MIILRKQNLNSIMIKNLAVFLNLLLGLFDSKEYIQIGNKNYFIKRFSRFNTELNFTRKQTISECEIYNFSSKENQTLSFFDKFKKKLQRIIGQLLFQLFLRNKLQRDLRIFYRKISSILFKNLDDYHSKALINNMLVKV